MKEPVIPTGNEYLSIPEIHEKDASIQSVNFLHMGYRGLIELGGDRAKNIPFLRPFLSVGGAEQPVDSLRWERRCRWIPSCLREYSGFALRCMILAPLNERGFIYRMEVENTGKEPIEVSFGLDGLWRDTVHAINESKPMTGQKRAYRSIWNDSFVCELIDTATVLSFAPCLEGAGCQSDFTAQDGEVRFRVSGAFTLEPGERRAENFFWGVCLEEVSAVTSAKQMLRQGFEKELAATESWLSARLRSSGNERLDAMFNTNLFFNYFFASGITMDTEEMVLVTSRSPRYYVSAAYWDRDSLLWSFPAILLTDAPYARQMLLYVFGRQNRNIGMHSRFIDGVLLEPGFELDELCAPVIALHNYVRMTGDRSILSDPSVSRGVERILAVLETKKNEKAALYETFLLPSDDVASEPYVTYDNALVWKAFVCLAELFAGLKTQEDCLELRQKAADVREAVFRHCVVDREGKKMFAWSVDLKGGMSLYDEPPGSLELLPFYGFCGRGDECYVNTMAYLERPDYAYSFRGIPIAYRGCAHAPHPWVLSIANSLIGKEKDRFLDVLPLLKLDNGIVCESVDESTGKSATGDAFATCAGFFAYALYLAFYSGEDDAIGGVNDGEGFGPLGD